MNCLLESVASLWIGLIHTVSRKALETDLVTTAKEQLRDTIQTMNAQISKHNTELVDITNVVREQRATMSKERLKTLLVKSKRARASISTIHSKLSLMESQLDALENNDVNKTILSTLQTSAKAMKKMGLASDLRKTDEVISQLEESMEHAHDINSTVNSGISILDSTGVDDDSLELELNILLGIEDPAPERLTSRQPAVLAPPATTNTIGTNVADDDKNDHNATGSGERCNGNIVFKPPNKIATAITEEPEEEEETGENSMLQATA